LKSIPRWIDPEDLDACVRFDPLFATGLVSITGWRCLVDGPALAQERSHSSHTLTIVASGAFVLLSRGRSMFVAPSCAVLHVPELPYNTEHPCGCGDRGWNLAFPRDVMEEVLAPVGGLPASTAVRSIPGRALLRLRLLLESGNVEPLAVEEAALQALDGWAGARGWREPGRAATAEAHRRCVETIQRVLYERRHEPVRLADLARAVHTSPYHLCRLFKESVGMPIHRYLTRLRLLDGLESLAAADVPLTGLALDLGFSSHSHFTAAFHRELGMTPSRFRQLASRERVGILKSL
jgi:AraC-like DNA-binding protein